MKHRKKPKKKLARRPSGSVDLTSLLLHMDSLPDVREWSVAGIARAYGVTHNAIRWHLKRHRAERWAEYAAWHQARRSP